MVNNRQTIFGGIAGIIAFLTSIFLFNFPLPMGIIISIGIYFGVFFLTKPTYRIGSVDIDSIANGKEIKDLLDKAGYDLKIIESSGKNAKHKEIKANAEKLHHNGLNILNYLNKNPKKILSARRFLSYYLDTASDIMEKYTEFTNTNLKSKEMEEIYSKTNRALVILNEAFEKQFLKLMQNEFFDIEADINVLEKTLKMDE
jgi:5-bromo-4-chloroindolyl phosphate hydrolysis protein